MLNWDQLSHPIVEETPMPDLFSQQKQIENCVNNIDNNNKHFKRNSKTINLGINNNNSFDAMFKKYNLDNNKFCFDFALFGQIDYDDNNNVIIVNTKGHCKHDDNDDNVHCYSILQMIENEQYEQAIVLLNYIYHHYIGKIPQNYPITIKHDVNEKIALIEYYFAQILTHMMIDKKHQNKEYSDLEMIEVCYLQSLSYQWDLNVLLRYIEFKSQIMKHIEYSKIWFAYIIPETIESINDENIQSRYFVLKKFFNDYNNSAYRNYNYNNNDETEQKQPQYSKLIRINLKQLDLNGHQNIFNNSSCSNNNKPYQLKFYCKYHRFTIYKLMKDKLLLLKKNGFNNELLNFYRLVIYDGSIPDVIKYYYNDRDCWFYFLSLNNHCKSNGHDINCHEKFSHFLNIDHLTQNILQTFQYKKFENLQIILDYLLYLASMKYVCHYYDTKQTVSIFYHIFDHIIKILLKHQNYQTIQVSKYFEEHYVMQIWPYMDVIDGNSDSCEYSISSIYQSCLLSSLSYFKFTHKHYQTNPNQVANYGKYRYGIDKIKSINKNTIIDQCKQLYDKSMSMFDVTKFNRFYQRQYQRFQFEMEMNDNHNSSNNKNTKDRRLSIVSVLSNISELSALEHHLPSTQATDTLKTNQNDKVKSHHRQRRSSSAELDIAWIKHHNHVLKPKDYKLFSISHDKKGTVKSNARPQSARCSMGSGYNKHSSDAKTQSKFKQNKMGQSSSKFKQNGANQTYMSLKMKNEISKIISFVNEKDYLKAIEYFQELMNDEYYVRLSRNEKNNFENSIGKESKYHLVIVYLTKTQYIWNKINCVENKDKNKNNIPQCKVKIEKYFDKSLHLLPQFYISLYLYGDYLFKIGEPYQSLKQFEKSYYYNDKYFPCVRKLVDITKQLKKYHEAIKYLKQCINICQNDNNSNDNINQIKDMKNEIQHLQSVSCVDN